MTDWEAINAKPTRELRRIVERELRAALAGLDPGQVLTTTELAERMGVMPAHRAIYQALLALGRVLPSLCDRVPEVAQRGWRKGQVVHRCLWSRRPPADQPRPLPMAAADIVALLRKHDDEIELLTRRIDALTPEHEE